VRARALDQFFKTFPCRVPALVKARFGQMPVMRLFERLAVVAAALRADRPGKRRRTGGFIRSGNAEPFIDRAPDSGRNESAKHKPNRDAAKERNHCNER